MREVVLATTPLAMYFSVQSGRKPTPIPGMPVTITDIPRHDAETRDGRHDFDFLHGRWRVHNRRLRRPLSGSTEWDEFEGTSMVRPLWEGLGNMEEWEADAPSGRIRAISAHLYDPGARQWRLYWATSDRGRFGVPTVGSFSDGRGEFFDQEEFEGRTILLRLSWEPRGPAACRFEQAFSEDGGRTWEVNWIMDFARLS